MFRTQHFHCRGHGFNLWLGTEIPQAKGVAKKTKEKEFFLRDGQRKRILPRILEGTVKAVGKAPR